MYLLSVAADDAEKTPDKAVNCLQGWVDCFEKAEIAGSLFCGGITDPGEANGKAKELEAAYQFGKMLE